MSKFKRISFIIVVCLVCYCAFFYKSDLFSTKQKHQGSDVVSTQDNPTKRQNNRKHHSLNFSSAVLQDHDLLFKTTRNSSTRQSIDLRKLKTVSVYRSKNKDHERHWVPYLAHPGQRNADFVTVGNLFVFGTYLDLRQQGNATIRILTFKHKNHNDSLELRFTDRKQRYSLHASIYQMCENHDKLYEGWILSYHLPQTLLAFPHQISLSPVSLNNQNHSSVSISFNLNIIPSETESDAKQIGVCVPPLFGRLKMSSILNFIMMCKILGADMIFLYLGKVSSELMTFVRRYSRDDGSVSVVEWNLPEKVSDSEDSIWYHGQLLAIQDCLYHNMASFHFLLFMDLDEMLVPQTTSSWRQMLTQIFAMRKKRSVVALSFNSVFLDPTRTPDNSDNILYFRHLRRTKAVSKVRTKLMVQPLKVLELGIHHMSKAVRVGYDNVDVDPKVALLYHYHMCVTSYEPFMKCYPTTHDTTLLRYRDTLTEWIHTVIDKYSGRYL